MAMVVVAYYRVSTEEQSRKGYSLPEQRRECRVRAQQLATDQGARLQLFEFEDAASGEVLDRPGLDACREFLRQTPAQYFVCLDPDRFARSLFLQLLVTEEIERHGVQLVFVQHQYETTAEGRLFYQLRGAIAEYEKAKIKERTARGRRGKLAAGGIPVFVEPWGYVWDRQQKALRVDPRKAPWVVQLFAWFVAGCSYQAIARKLSELGVAPPKGGKAWYRSAVSRILHNPVYVGQLLLNRGDYEGLTPLRKVPRWKRRPLTHKVRPPAEWVTVQVPAIVPPQLWQQAQALLAGRRRLSQRGVGLLSGLCVCGLCGESLHYARHHGRRYLRCYGRYPQQRGAPKDGGPPAPCRLPHLPADHLESAVWQQVLEWLLDRAELLELLRQSEQGHALAGRCPSPGQNAAILRRELAAREAAFRRAVALAVEGLTPEGYEPELRRLKAAVNALKAEVDAAATAERATEEAQGGIISNLAQLSAVVKAALEGLDLTERQKVVRMLVQRITLWPRRWEYQFRADPV